MGRNDYQTEGRGSGRDPVDEKRAVSRGPIIVGAILITVGLVFLIANTIQPGLNISTIWPLIIIAWGAAVAVTGLIPPPNLERVMQGILLTIIGVVFLYNVLGIIPFAYWLDLVSFWPVLLIALGLAILSDALRSKLLALLPPLLIIGVIIITFFYHHLLVFPGGTERFSYSKDMSGRITNGSAAIEIGAGILNMGASDKLYEINGRDAYSNTGPLVNYVRDGNEVELDVEPRPGNRARSWTLNRSTIWNVDLAKDIDWRLTLKTGVSEAKLDLRRLKVSHININSGISDIEVRLSDETTMTTGTIKTGIASAKLLVPVDSGLRLRVKNGISSTNINNLDTNRAESGDRVIYTTPGFNDASSKIDLDIDLGISSFTVEGY